MIATAHQPCTLLSRLPNVRGRYDENALLAAMCWFKVGGAADIIYVPADTEDLADFLANVPSDIPLTLFGAGSNVLVRDGGVRGVCIKLMGGFAQLHQQEDLIYAGAAVPDVKIARAAADWSRTGLEFYRGIPGTCGGAIAMNAGAYGSETCDVLAYVDALDKRGRHIRLTPDDFKFAYRYNGYSDFALYIGAAFHTTAGDATQIKETMDAIATERGDSQPIKSRTGGSTFKNPRNQKAWQLIDDAGCRGLRNGGAQISEQHCNFLINHGEASALDLETLGETTQARVQTQSGITLEWEIKRIGEAI
ncbi:MAG: UDP-N-acetylmuramate dehydrogenase [Alphaproteobacteria bacterium]|nr:UDP-N-acetylmuramate dehydrogenase [Alphaproteobacteria bacterium]MBE8219734.1 UDP-N-acetylmuramate dehydrogenase [Alphaproteobacteria bacterium]